MNVGIVKAFGKQDLEGAQQAWEQVIKLAPNSPEGQAAQRALESLRSAHPPGAAQRPGALMIRFILLFILLTIAARMFWRLVDGIIEGATGQSRPTRSSRAPAPSVPMVRDPVCGTFVLPDRAVTLV